MGETLTTVLVALRSTETFSKLSAREEDTLCTVSYEVLLSRALLGFDGLSAHRKWFMSFSFPLDHLSSRTPATHTTGIPLEIQLKLWSDHCFQATGI